MDPRHNRAVEQIPVPSQPRFLAASEDSIWVLSQGDGSLTRIDPRTSRVSATIPLDVPGDGGDIAVGEGYIWVSAEGVPVSQIDPSRNVLPRQFVGGKKDDTLRVGFGSVWVISEVDGDLWRIEIDALNRVPVAPRRR